MWESAVEAAQGRCRAASGSMCRKVETLRACGALHPVKPAGIEAVFAALDPGR